MRLRGTLAAWSMLVVCLKYAHETKVGGREVDEMCPRCLRCTWSARGMLEVADLCPRNALYDSIVTLKIFSSFPLIQSCIESWKSEILINFRWTDSIIFGAIQKIRFQSNNFCFVGVKLILTSLFSPNPFSFEPIQRKCSG
jgi:hypothetical protein